MTETTSRRRGPAPTGKALSNAERQRRYIARLKAKAAPENPVTDELAAAQARIAELERLVANLKALTSEQTGQLVEMDNKLRKAEWHNKREVNRLIRERDEAKAELAAIKALPQKPVSNSKRRKYAPAAG